MAVKRVGPCLAVLAGAALYALGLPPFDRALAGWLALVPLLLIVRGRSSRSAFAYGALYGYACSCAVGMSWLAPALARFFDTGLPTAFGLATVYGFLFWGSAFGLFAAGAAIVLRREPTAGTRLQLAALWVATELLRARLCGQPWGLLGYTQHAHVGVVQLSALTGVYGVSFLLALVSAGTADALVLARAGRAARSFRVVALPALLAAMLWALGATLVADGPIGGYSAQTVAVVQTNVAPARDWTRAYTDAQVAAHVQATLALPPAARPALVIWPEHAVPRYLEEEPLLAAQLGGLAARTGADLLFGAPRYDAGRTYNSVRLITAAGRNGGAYDKRRLVLLAESTPFSSAESALPGENPRQFSTGDGPLLLTSFVPLGLSICHEVLFPELVASSVAAGAALLVNVSNDGWLDGGHGIASRQHFAMAVFRAVETRRYLVRAATTGVSGIIDPYGRVLDVLGPGAAGHLTRPVAGRTAITPYVRVGDAFAFGCALAAGLALLASRRAVPLQRLYPRLTPSPRTS